MEYNYLLILGKHHVQLGEVSKLHTRYDTLNCIFW
jgi:hypothetical protein